MSGHRLEVLSLTKEAFAPFGDVIETDGSPHYPINQGTTERFHDLAAVDVLEKSGRPLINIFRAQPLNYPLRVEMMERHPLSSQAFIPLSDAPFMVLVAPTGKSIRVPDLRAFITNGRQGVNYRRAIWHHPVLALRPDSDFLVVDRGGPGENCDELHFEGEEILLTL